MLIYLVLVYVFSVFGGFLSDCVWGSCKIVFIGGVFIMLGYIVLLMLFGVGVLFVLIVFIVIGIGLLKLNVFDMVG